MALRGCNKYGGYNYHSSIKSYLCFYCGEHGDHKDHVPPRYYLDFMMESPKMIVRSCRDCNYLLGNKPYFTLLSRCEYLLCGYRKKYQKNLSMPHWNETEINGLTGRLKKTVILSQYMKSFIEGKLKHIEGKIDELQETILAEG